MRLAIPSAPRAVRLRQVPGAIARLGVVASIGLVSLACLGWLSVLAGGWLSSEREFFARALVVSATVSEVTLPPLSEREGGEAKLSVLYTVADHQLSVPGVVTDALRGETLGKGSRVELLVSPDDVTHPREAQYARAQLLRSSLPWGLALGGALAVGLFWRELRRALRRELAPLRVGMLVWLTPDGPLPATRRELVFSGSYWKDDVKFEVRARARPGRAPVRNADKLLAAVLPAEPSWVRVIDEDLARALGWFER